MIEDVIDMLDDALQLGERRFHLNANTPLLGSIAEFDSMTVVTLLTAFEDRYGFIVEDDEISADTFATVGSLTEFLEAKVGS